MNYLAVLFLPIFLVLIFIYCLIKKVKIYDAFVEGSKNAFNLALSIFPYLVAIMVAFSLFNKSGLADKFCSYLSPITSFFGIPKELTKLIILKPFSGSGSLSLLTEILSTYGADSRLGVLASLIYGSSETIFYISAVYFAKAKTKKLLKPILLALIISFLTSIFTCLII